MWNARICVFIVWKSCLSRITSSNTLQNSTRWNFHKKTSNNQLNELIFKIRTLKYSLIYYVFFCKYIFFLVDSAIKAKQKIKTVSGDQNAWSRDRIAEAQRCFAGLRYFSRVLKGLEVILKIIRFGSNFVGTMAALLPIPRCTYSTFNPTFNITWAGRFHWAARSSINCRSVFPILNIKNTFV